MVGRLLLPGTPLRMLAAEAGPSAAEYTEPRNGWEIGEVNDDLSSQMELRTWKELGMLCWHMRVRTLLLRHVRLAGIYSYSY